MKLRVILLQTQPLNFPCSMNFAMLCVSVCVYVRAGRLYMRTRVEGGVVLSSVLFI